MRRHFSKIAFVVVLILTSSFCISCYKSDMNNIEHSDIVFYIDGEGQIAKYEAAKNGEKISAPEIAPRDEYILDGWYKDAQFSVKWDFEEDTVSGDITLYAKWVLLVKVTFYFSAEEGDSQTVTYAYGSKTLSVPVSFKQSLILTGWYKDNGLTEAWDIENDIITEDIPLYASWKESALPAVILNTENGAEIESKEVYIKATVSITNCDESYQISEAAADVRGRGNSTWAMEKKPYRIKFDKKVSVLGSTYTAKNWTLIANYSDKSLMRNYLANSLASRLDGLSFASTVNPVELYLNGSYQGVYLLCDHIQVNDGRVEIEYDKNDPSKSDYFIELDSRAEEEGEQDIDWIEDDRGRRYVIKTPERGDVADMADYAAYVKEFLNGINALIETENIDFEELSKRIDLASFIDFYIVQEIFKNTDVGFTSVYMYIKDGILYMGPVWDFDISAGNSDYIDYRPEGIFAGIENGWYKSLLENETFFGMVRDRWNDILENEIAAMFTELVSVTEMYFDEFSNNFNRWQIIDIYVWPNPPEVVAANTYLKQVEFLYDFLESRILWLTEYYNSMDEV